MVFVYTSLAKYASNAILSFPLVAVAVLVHDMTIMYSAAGLEKEVGGIKFAGIVR
jgi:hypothetical protein